MNKTANYELTIIIPVYNEQDNMERLENTLSNYIKESSVKCCALFVNDGSKDDSLNLIKKACNENNDFLYISLSKNSGLSAAMKAGIDVAESKYLGYMDADMQTDVRDFETLLKYAQQYKLVMGIRANRKDSAFKLMQSKIANSFRRMMTHDGATDTGCPLKIIHSDYAKRIPFFTGMHRFLPALIKLQDGGTFYEVPVRHYPREAGVSKYNLWNRLISPFKDCFAFRWMAHRYINYNIGDSNL
ncbi:glycosyltransferase [Phocaeicola paurosaccharolyticus]|uniref:glycosyltransferase n=1 Tax=Phocaeicola paurosaccharolyticus TaxID=732242 RepID=UPI002FE16F2D